MATNAKNLAELLNTDTTIADADIATGITASKLTGALPAISGAALTDIDNPIDDHLRVTFSGPTVSNNSVTFLTPTLQGQTNGGFTLQNTNEIKERRDVYNLHNSKARINFCKI